MAGVIDSPYGEGWFRQQLAEAIAWCSAHASLDAPGTSLRTFTPNYYPLISEHQQLSEVVHLRRERLKADGILNIKPALNLAGGRLLAYYPGHTLSDGTAQFETEGFLDANNCPSVDTWVWMQLLPLRELGSALALVAWIPAGFVDLVDDGVKINPEECAVWLDTLDNPFTQSLRRLNLLS